MLFMSSPLPQVNATDVPWRKRPRSRSPAVCNGLYGESVRSNRPAEEKTTRGGPVQPGRKYTWNRAVLKGMAPAIKLMIAGAVVGVLRNRLAFLFGTATAPGLGL